jgi:5-methylcytosine-specific restriction endonuclease McrA
MCSKFRNRNMYKHKCYTYNFLTVLDLVFKYKIDKQGMRWKQTFFKCRCICGKEKIIYSQNVIIGITKSCGCKKNELCLNATQKHYNKTYKSPVEGRLYSNYKKDGKEFFLLFDEFSQLVNSNCYYCGSKPFLIRYNKTKSREKPLNGIDRLNSKLGYIKENCVPCCVHCNRAKMDRSEKDFKEWVDLVHSYQHKDNEGKLSLIDIATKEFWQSDKVSSLYPESHGRN